MHIFHKYRYYGYTYITKWLGGGGWKPGIPYEAMIEAKKCTKCGKVKEV